MTNEYIYSQIFSILNTKPYAYDTYPYPSYYQVLFHKHKKCVWLELLWESK